MSECLQVEKNRVGCCEMFMSAMIEMFGRSQISLDEIGEDHKVEKISKRAFVFTCKKISDIANTASIEGIYDNDDDDDVQWFACRICII